jgi:hypothetical protein
MLSDKEREYLKSKTLINKNYQYVLKHRIDKKIEDLTEDLEYFLHDPYFREILKHRFKNFNERVQQDLRDPYLW